MNTKMFNFFNDFFKKNSDYYVHSCQIDLEGKISIRSHDDGEVSIQFPFGNSDLLIINNIFDTYNLDKNLISILKSKPGYYFGIDKESNVTGNFESFDDYLKNGRNKE